MANSNEGREVSNRVNSSSAEQDLTAGFSEPLQEIPGSPYWDPFLVDVNKGKTPSVHTSSDHVDKNQTADTRERLRDFSSIYRVNFSDFSPQLKRHDPDSPRKFDDTGYGAGAGDLFPALPNIDGGSSRVTECFSKPSPSSPANNSKETSILESLPTIRDIRNVTTFGFDTNASSYKQQPHAEVNVIAAEIMRSWYKDLCHMEGPIEPLSTEQVMTLAILLKLRPQTVHNWVTQNLITGSNKDEQAASRSLANTTISDPTKNLSWEILQLVERYVNASNQKTTAIGGYYRLFNAWKYECTFGCGYRTKFVLNWERHEESHQPQNFWLCAVCNQEKRPVCLVHRPEKLREHIQDKHASSNTKDLIESSQLAYKAGFKPRCGFCGYAFKSWEDRNKHILYHFNAEGSDARNMSQWRESSSSDGSDKVSGGLETARRAVLRILLSDPVLAPSFATAAQKVARDRFDLNIQFLIKRYSLDLLKEVQDARERDAVQILKDNVLWFAAHLQRAFSPRAPSRKVRIQETLEHQKFDHLYLLKKHHATTIHSDVVEAKDNKTSDTIDAIDPFEDDPELIDYYRFPKIEQTRTFLTGSIAFQRLLESLQHFISEQVMEIYELINQPSQELASREILELSSGRPTKRGLEKLLDDDDYSKPRKRQLHQTSLGLKTGEQTEAMACNNADQDEAHSSSSPLSPSTKLTDIAMPSAPRSVEDISNEGTSGINDSVEDPDDRFLNPTSYFNKLKSLRSMVFQNSAIQHHSSSVIIPTTNNESAISSNQASLPMARINECNIRLRISFHQNEWFETGTSDDFWLGACSRTSSKEIFDLLECRNLMVRVYSSLKSLQKAGFCGSFFSILVLDKHRPSVARLVPIQIASVEFLVQLFHTTLTAIGHAALSSLILDISDRGGAKFIAGNTYSTRCDLTLSKALTKSCLDLLALVHLEPAGTAAPQYIWRSTANVLDLAVLSYVGAHTENISETYLQTPISSFIASEHSIPDRDQRDEDCGSENYIYMKQRKLQCLDQFLRQKDVWVFHMGAAITSDQRLCLSTDADTLTDIWGPMWKTKSDPSAREVSRYNIGNGFIVPWPRNSSDPEPRSHTVGQMEVFCHWIPSRNWGETLVSQHQSNLRSKQFLEIDMLLIGADVKNRLVVNDDCHMSLDRKLKIKEAWKNRCNLRHIGTRKPQCEKDSQSYQVQASAMGFVTVGSTVSYKRFDGFDMKDALIERWRNGTRKIQELEVWGGVEVSLCTQNARRRTLRHLLGCSGMRNYLRGISFKWHDDDCERQYFESLENCQTFRKFWKNYPQWHDNVGAAINECFSVLEETGVDETNDELAVLWVEVLEELDKDESDEVALSVDASFNFTPAEEHLVILRRSEHSWTGFLRDSPESLTMAIIGDKCLDFRAAEDYGMRCQDIRLGKNGTVPKRYSLGYSALHTSLLINEELVKSMNIQYRYPDRKRKRRICGATGSNVELEEENCRGRPQQHECLLENLKGHWDMMNIKKCSNFSLGIRGYLTLYKRPVVSCDPLLVEWGPVLNTLGKELKTDFNERVLGKSGDKYHSEYNGGIWKFSPVPCLLISKTVNQR